jgi:hypothetical protein
MSLISLTKIALEVKAEIWLQISVPDNFLELVCPQYQQQLKQQFVEKELKSSSYSSTDLELVWQESWQKQLEISALKTGYKGFKIGESLLVNHQGELHLIKVIKIEINEAKPLLMQWQASGQIQSYNLYELRQLKVSKLRPLVHLSPNVVYQISEDQSYFQAWFGFKSKKLASSWLRPIRREIGSLSHLKSAASSELIRTGKKYEYSVEKFKHKSLKKRLAVLNNLAQLDLERLP